MCLCWLWREEISRAPGSQETLARYGVSGGAGASLSVFEVQTHLPGLSRGNHPSADLAACERARGDAVSAGVELWSRLLSLRRAWDLAV